MTRWKAAGIHLSLSLLIGTIAFCLLYFVYYPQPFFVAAGADVLVLILLGVDVALGPLLTLAVFKSGKWGMKFDLMVIAALQIGALAYGLYVMWNARPVFIVGVVDRMEIIYANSLTKENLALASYPEFKREPLFGPVFAVTRSPAAGPEQEEVIENSFNGLDIQFFPKYYVRLTNERFNQFAINADRQKQLPERAKRIIQDYLAQKPPKSAVIAVPMQGRTQEFTLILDAKSGSAIAAIPVSAWD